MFFKSVLNLPAIRLLAHRLTAAVSTLPDLEAWLYAAVLLLAFTIIALPVGFQRGFLPCEALRMSWKTIIGIIATSFLMPAVTEELFFRVLLLPHPTENVSGSGLWFWGCISLVSFIIYHPLNAMTFFPQGVETFFNWIFLLLAALLGLICSLTYLQSGSLWTPVAIHWLVVVVWLVFLGRYKRLYVDS
ncbi:MAG: CPBP family intramembrane metalloprotease [Coleofasciculus sp. S288]|nr:CPBP family intramembrane metalloprotease [Coleofasciculus sp. S288]